jgi:hypothetical protein
MIYCRDIALHASSSPDGKGSVELVPIDGDYYFPAYSSIAEVVALCQERGIPAKAWPIYSGVDDHAIPLEDVRRRCEDLRQQLGRIEPEEIARHGLLQRVWGCLSEGDIFCVVD